MLLVGCSPNSGSRIQQEPKPDPHAAAELPVALNPGLYEVSISGGTMVQLPSGEYSGTVCFSSADADGFARKPLAAIFPEWPGCSTVDDPKGNAIRGKRTCEGRLPAWITYSGSHDANWFVIVGSVAQGHDETAMALHLGSGDFTIVGKRTGAC
jgi:hypothetical protein